MTVGERTAAYPALQATIELAGRTLRNRIVHASMTTRMQANGHVTDSLIRYHVNRALGGVAMTVSEPLAMIRQQAGVPKVQVREADRHDGLKRWAEAVESLDCRLLAQVQDPGRGRHYPGRSAFAIGPSHLPDDLSWSMPHALDTGEIERMIEDFAESSAILRRCGFSGVEISAGHGHLFHQFLSPHANRRDDEYGGDRKGRTRLVANLMAAIRAACGRDFIIGLKLAGNDGVPGGVDWQEAAEIAAILTRDAPMDYITFAQGAHARSLELHIPDRYGPPMPYMDRIRALRASVGDVPLMGLGRITDPAEAEGLVARGDCDLVAMGRTLLADPAWFDKAVQGRTAEIRYCLSCNTCWGYTIMHHSTLRCVNNPRVGRPNEADYRPPRADRRRRVVVVGAGVAGLEAAFVAAGRGHEVTVFGRSREVGGRTRLRSRLPGGETVTSIADYTFPMASRSGARFELGHLATVDDVLACRPDAVILATGGEMVPPDWLPTEARTEGLVPDLSDALWGVIDLSARQPGVAVIYDMDHSDAVYAAAEHLHGLFERVVLVTPRETIAEDMWMVARQGILRRMLEKRIEIVRLAEPVWTGALEEGELECRNVYTGDRIVISDVAFFAYATPRAPRAGLAAPLRGAGVAVTRVGDCRSPQDLMFATTEGHAAGEAV